MNINDSMTTEPGHYPSLFIPRIQKIIVENSNEIFPEFRPKRGGVL